jgi:hypothetical protein
MKRCLGCGVEKPLDAFHRTKKAKSGRVSRCAECVRAAYATRPLVDPVMDGDATCRECGETKHVTEFPRHKREPTGRHGVCKGCHRVREKDRREANPEEFLERRRTVGKASELRRYYGITLDDYREMVEAQGGGCAICGATAEASGRHLCVDHDHRCCPGRKRSCGQCIRGLLCSNCNRAIGWLGDDPDLAEKAAAYLRR